MPGPWLGNPAFFQGLFPTKKESHALGFTFGNRSSSGFLGTPKFSGLLEAKRDRTRRLDGESQRKPGSSRSRAAKPHISGASRTLNDPSGRGFHARLRRRSWWPQDPSARRGLQNQPIDQKRKRQLRARWNPRRTVGGSTKTSVCVCVVFTDWTFF